MSASWNAELGEVFCKQESPDSRVKREGKRKVRAEYWKDKEGGAELNEGQGRSGRWRIRNQHCIKTVTVAIKLDVTHGM